jgi:N utilization substance protein B
MGDKQKINTKTIARLAAVQVLYAMEISPKSNPKKLIADIVEYYTTGQNVNRDMNIDDDIDISYNKSFFHLLTEAAIQHIESNNEVILEYLKAPYNLDNTNSLLLSLLRVGIAELIYVTDTPFKVVINEFTNIAGSFLGENDVAFVNALLDSHAKIINEDRLIANAL